MTQNFNRSTNYILIYFKPYIHILSITCLKKYIKVNALYYIPGIPKIFDFRSPSPEN